LALLGRRVNDLAAGAERSRFWKEAIEYG
jgi:hypothetical protein